MIDSIPKRVLAQYNLGVIKVETVVSSGLIHKTFKLKTSKGTFIIQRLHAVLSSPEIAQDFKAVTEYLDAQEFLAPICVLTKKGDVLAKDGEFVWRMQTAIPGKTYHKLDSVKMAAQAGNIYARFHKVMDGIPHIFQSAKILHETEKVYAVFVEVVRNFSDSELLVDVKNDVDFVMKELPKLFLPAGLPLRVIHGDPKISNILFDAKGNARAIVDLDTCNRRPILVELGDAFRSWCGDAEDNANNTFRVPMFKAGWKGYSKVAGKWLTAKEKKLVPQAIGTITLELASRFLADYFTDNYFGWDVKRYESRRAHNLARARGQIALYKDLKKKMVEVKKAMA